MSRLSRVVEFFKTRKVTATVNPAIKVSYEHWTSFGGTPDVEEALKQAWQKLRSELDQSQIKKQRWNQYREGYKQEQLLVNIEEVLMELEGPYYLDPDYKPRPPSTPKSEEQVANEAIDELVSRNNLLWTIAHCSDFKFETLIQFLSATRGSHKKE